MPPKRPLPAPGGEAMHSRGKRFRGTVLVMMWLESWRVRGLTIEQVVRLHLEAFQRVFLEHIQTMQRGRVRGLTIEQVVRLHLEAFQRVFLEHIQTMQRGSWRVRGLTIEQVVRLHLDAFQRVFLDHIQTMQRTIEETRCNQLELLDLNARRLEKSEASHSNDAYAPPMPLANGLGAIECGTRTVQLRFVNGNSPRDIVYTQCPIGWKNGTDAKIAIFENDSQITSGDLSTVQVDIKVVHHDFFAGRGLVNFTEEEFKAQIVHPLSVLAGQLVVTLANGEASLGPFHFTQSSHRRKFRLAATVSQGQGLTVRVKEGITDSFTVKDRRSEANKKCEIPKRGDEVFRLERVARNGTPYKNLKSKGIYKLEDLLRAYHRDESGFQKLAGMTNKKDWDKMIEHAKKCVPGDELYSYNVMEESAVLFFNTFYDIVGAKFNGSYVPCSKFDQCQQHKVNMWKKSAYDELERSVPNHVMMNNHPEPAYPNDVTGPSMQATGTPRHLYDQTTNQDVADFGQQQSFSQQYGSSHHLSQENISNVQGTTQQIIPAQQIGLNITNDVCARELLNKHSEPLFINDVAGLAFSGPSTSGYPQPEPSEYHPMYGADQEPYLCGHEQTALREDALKGLSPILEGYYGGLLYEPSESLGHRTSPIFNRLPGNHGEQTIQMSHGGPHHSVEPVFNDVSHFQPNDGSS